MPRFVCVLLVVLGLLQFSQAAVGQRIQHYTCLDGGSYSLGTAKTHTATVFIFLSPECPLCQNYAPVIASLREQFSAQPIDIFAVFSGKAFNNKQIKAYLAEYALQQVSALLDPDMRLAHYVGAGSTPEAVVLNHKQQVVYRGAIDNWVSGLGKKKPAATRHYLKDALVAVQAGEAIKVKKTEAVGCLIE